MDYSVGLNEIKAARDSGGFTSVADVVDFMRDNGDNKIGLVNGFEMHFKNQLQGFPVLLDTTKPSEFHLICPVMSCEGYFGGGEKCVHFEDVLGQMNALGLTNFTVNEELIRRVMDKIGFNKSAFSGPGSYINALNTLEDEPFACEQFAASRFNNGMSIRVKFANGLAFDTCGDIACYKKAENLYGGSFYCSTHIREKRLLTNKTGTENAFKSAFKSLAYRHNPTVNANRLPPSIWTACMADIYERDVYKHAFEGSTVFIRLLNNGQLLYENVNKKMTYHKCPLPNCLKSVYFTKINGKHLKSKLCTAHKNNEAELTQLMADVKQLVRERSAKEDSSATD